MVENHTCICDTLCRTVDTAPAVPLHFPQEPEAVTHEVQISIDLLIEILLTLFKQQPTMTKKHDIRGVPSPVWKGSPYICIPAS